MQRATGQVSGSHRDDAVKCVQSWGRGDDCLLTSLPYLSGDQSRSYIWVDAVTLIYINPPDSHRWFPCVPPALIGWPQLPHALNIKILKFLGSGCSHQFWIQQLSGKIVPECLFTIDLNFQDFSKLIREHEAG